MIGDFAANRLITKTHPYNEPALVFYVRPGGNDNADGTSPATAFATFGRAMREMDLYSVNRPVVVDVTGMTGGDAIAAQEVLNLGGTQLGGLSFDRDVTVVPPGDLFFSRRHRQIRSELVAYTELEIIAQAQDPVTGLLTLTVSNAFGPFTDLQGKFAISGVLGEYGAIYSNTTGAGPNTVEVACATTFSSNTAMVMEPGATLQFGDPANSFEQAIYLSALCDWSLQGLYLTTGGAKTVAISVWPHSPVDFLFCELAGIEINLGADVAVECCTVRPDGGLAAWIQDGGSCRVTNSVLIEVDFVCHGSASSGLNEWQASILGSLLTPFGGGNVESRHTFEMQQCLIDDGPNEGVSATFGTSRMKDCIVQSMGKSAIVVSNPGAYLLLDNVQGTGNAGFGIEASLGCQVRAFNATAVTGTVNDAFVGSIGATSWAAIAASPGGAVTDLDHLVRVSSS